MFDNKTQSNDASHRAEAKTIFGRSNGSRPHFFEVALQTLLLPVRALIALTATPTLSQPTSEVIYDDALAPNWGSDSWNATRDMEATAPVKVGTKSIALKFDKGGDSGAVFYHDGFAIAGKKTLEFWVNGGASGGQKILVSARDTRVTEFYAAISLDAYLEGGAVAASVWRKATIPLAALKLGAAPLTGIIIQTGSENAQPTFYLDQITLSTEGAAPPIPTGPEAPNYPASNPMGTVPAALPANFMIGLGNYDATWIENSGSNWQARYKYLVGGVNTPDGWASWELPRGQFATSYLNASAHAGVMPVFTYYQLLQSNPRRYDESNDAYVEKFANAQTMRAYYDDFKLLMEKCGAFDKSVIVHVEPDVWGYLQQTQANPNNYAVKVAASGHSDAVGLPDTAVGYAQMLRQLRNLYAPKVMLAIHASSWSAGADVTLNIDPALDIAAQADATGAYLNQLSEGWDLIFADFADRDAAYYQLTQNKATWWDETNVHLPSFHQAHFWLSKLNQKTGKRIVVWQVPIGNTQMRSCDNTTFHYQDNRVQYYLGAAYSKTHIAELKQCGVVGLFFGAGDETNTTTPYDSAKDGITNPAPISGNTGEAKVSDDDGGFLRERNAAYQGDPVTLK